MLKSGLATLLIITLSVVGCKSGESTQSTKTDTLKVLIVDGQNNHNVWPKSTVMMKQYLEESGLFEVDVERTAFTWKGDKYLSKYPLANGKTVEDLPEPKADLDYRPQFSNYDVVLSNFGWNAASWPEETESGLESFVKNGGGLVIIHAADNSFPEWLEFNRMIGLGGWGDRTEKDGPYVYYNDAGEMVRDTSAGRGGHHGAQHEFEVVIRDTEHPITQGMPPVWLHTKDELYEQLRGPAENMHILATAYADEQYGGSTRHEPMIFTIDYGQGRVFHTPMGHEDYSMECVGFITTLVRGTEWAATGKVSQTELPQDFPTAERTSSRKFGVAK